MLFADDLGYGDLGVYGNPTIRTPNLDRLASEGTADDGVLLGTVLRACAHTQPAIGTLPEPNERERQLRWGGDGGIPDEYVTLAQALGAAGYRTAMAGKWHLGYGPRRVPAGRKGLRQLVRPAVLQRHDQAVGPNGRAPVACTVTPSVFEHPVDQDQLTLRYTAEVCECDPREI